MSQFVDVMLATAANGRDRGMTTGEPAAPVRRTWAEVHERARRMAGALDVAPGTAIAVLAAEPAVIVPAVQAAWLCGGSVTMLHQPTPRTDLAEWAEDTLRVLAMIDSRLVLLGSPFDALASVLDQHGIPYRLLSELDGEPIAHPVPTPEDATALLQLTSGSTADPKAVRITHRNLMANAEGMRIAAALDPESDVMISWLPLFHDMGMVGFLTVPMLYGLELVKVTPVDFLSRPTLWADLITRYRGTITAAPNFAYAIVARRLASSSDDFDLSSMRLALNGAEPIDPAAVQAFVDAGARFGLRPESILAAYGMAETTLGVAFAPLFTGLSVDVVDADAVEADRRAVPAAEGRAFPLLGPPLPGLELRVVDDSGKVLGVRDVGELQIRGEAVTPGYLTVNGPLATQDAEGWLSTGDLGYLVEDGQVVVCGRRKDVIIMGGRNIYPTDVERAACAVDGVRAGNAVAVRLDAGTQRERFAVVVESKLAGDSEAEKDLVKQVTARVVDAVGLRPFAVVVQPPGTLPKTPSGKLRRSAAAALV
ncbi:fatty acyl-AMP ligase [Lentzea flava]|uniref:Fatty-acyl-CoA synthase n=1 Tax=Lentzea flava TaxID=103732 RepID=A0ABQ2VBG0_9PSEU|nr:fatty acyl-AMP ligase [Lentzea flava]MCP2203933.1 fatty-acyl-CoA synthase [Lentzea flava]GGU72981.1 fatty-acyl-CoA synthase [Lentzea flava]